MGTKIDCKRYLAGFNSMRNHNEESSTSSWPIFFRDKMMIPNRQYYNGFMQMSGYLGQGKDALKQKMLEHEAVFKNQVLELHRLYRIQREMMEEVKRKGTNTYRASVEPASSGFQGSQVPQDEARKWHMAGFPILNTSYGRTSIFGVEIVNSPPSYVKINAAQPGQLPFPNGPTSKDPEVSRPMKLRKKLFDLQIPVDDNIDIQEGENPKDHESSMELFLGGRGSKGSNGLADLNKPVQVEEIVGPSSVDFLSQAENVHVGFSINSSIESKVNTRERLSHICDTGSSRGNLSFATQGPQSDKLPLPSHPVQGMLNQAHHPPVTYPSGYYGMDDMWRGNLDPQHELESHDKIHAQSKCDRSEPVTVSQTPGPYRFDNSSCFANSWVHSASSSSKSMNNSSAQNVTTSNGFSHTPVLGSNELQRSVCSTNNGFLISPICSRHAGPKPAIDINLNEDFSNGVVIPQDLNGEGKSKDYLSALPWLKHMPTKKKTGIPIFQRLATKSGPSPLASSSVSFDCRLEEKNVTNKIKNGLIDINVACEPNEQIAAEDLALNKEPTNCPIFRDHYAFDLNSSFSDCEDPPPSPLNYERKTASVKITLEIDLEVPIFVGTEGDNSPPSKQHTQAPSKQHTQDGVLLQTKEKQINDYEVLRDAAETMVAISSLGPVPLPINTDKEEASLAEVLLLFKDFPFKMDDFEATTLNLAETKEEDYMPKPFMFEIPKTEDANGAHCIQTRSRRGQLRRGRQRTDFQRDILPGLTTLSRHEMTEDLQAFGGMMRAMGHSWNSSLTRRNGGGRGRKRTVSVDNNVPPPATIGSSVCAPLLKRLNNQMEDQSLTGWGKTTRRPRRQRCSVGNISTVLLT